MKKTLVAVAVGLFACQAHSAAFQLNETSASGLGRAYAGDAVIADDAAVLARNPAAMSLFDSKALSLSAIYVDPGVDVSGQTDSRLDQDGAAPTAAIPGFYYINPVNDRFAWGAAVYSNFGLGTDYDTDYLAGLAGGNTEIMSVNANLSGSFKVNENFSLGAGINAVYADAELNRYAGGTGGRLRPAPDTNVMGMAGDDIAFGWNVGAVYEINENHRFGLAYHSAVDLTLEGDYTALNGAHTGGGSLDLATPEFIEFSGFHQLTDAWAVHYSVMYTDWSSFETLEAYPDGSSDPLFTKDEDFDSTMRYAIGATYTYSPDLTLRMGIAKDESASNTHQSISIPDSDRMWYSVGATYHFSPRNSIDLAVSYIDGDSVEFTEEVWDFESEGNAWLVGVQYNHTF